jgi:ribosomal protein S18 acetylase RimI-like enzyme
VFNGAEPRVFVLIDKATNDFAAQAVLWDMEGQSIRLNMPTIGILDWFVQPALRGQGIGKFLMVQMLRRAQEDLAEIVEVQLPAENQAGLKLCQLVGFEHVDLGHRFERRT